MSIGSGIAFAAFWLAFAAVIMTDTIMRGC